MSVLWGNHSILEKLHPKPQTSASCAVRPGDDRIESLYKYGETNANYHQCVPDVFLIGLGHQCRYLRLSAEVLLTMEVLWPRAGLS